MSRVISTQVPPSSRTYTSNPPTTGSERPPSAPAATYAARPTCSILITARLPEVPTLVARAFTKRQPAVDDVASPRRLLCETKRQSRTGDSAGVVFRGLHSSSRSKSAPREASREGTDSTTTACGAVISTALRRLCCPRASPPDSGRVIPVAAQLVQSRIPRLSEAPACLRFGQAAAACDDRLRAPRPHELLGQLGGGPRRACCAADRVAQRIGRSAAAGQGQRDQRGGPGATPSVLAGGWVSWSRYGSLLLLSGCRRSV